MKLKFLIKAKTTECDGLKRAADRLKRECNKLIVIPLAGRKTLGYFHSLWNSLTFLDVASLLNSIHETVNFGA